MTDHMSVDDIEEGMTIKVPGALGSEPLILRVDDVQELSPGHVKITVSEIPWTPTGELIEGLGF